MLGIVGHNSNLSTRSLRLENYLEFEISYTVSTRPARAKLIEYMTSMHNALSSSLQHLIKLSKIVYICDLSIVG